MQVLVGRLRNREGVHRRGAGVLTQLFSALTRKDVAHLEPWKSFRAFSKHHCVSGLIDSVSDSASEQGELVLGNRQLDCAVREVKR